MENLFITSVAFLFLLTVLSFSKIIFGDYLSPVGLYSVIWSLAIAVYHLGVISFPGLDAKTWFLILSGWMGFALGCLCIYYALGAPEKSKKENSRAEWRNYLAENEKILRKLVIVSSSASVLIGGFALNLIVSHFGAADFVQHYALIRHDVALPGGNITEFSYAKSPFIHVAGMGFIYSSAAIGAFYVGFIRKNYLLGYIPMLSMLLMSVAEGGRTNLADVIMMYGAGFYFGRFYIRRKGSLQATLVMFLGACGIVVISLLTGKLGEEAELSRVPLNPVVAHLSYRVTVPIANLNEYVSSEDSKNYLGEASFNPVFRILNELGLHETYVRIAHTGINSISGWYAVLTYSYLKWPFDDFGYLGPFCLAVLYGSTVMVFFLCARLRVSLGAMLMLILLYPTVVYSVATWKIQDMSFFFAVLGVCIIVLSSAVCRPGLPIRKNNEKV